MKIYHVRDPQAVDAVLVDRTTPWGNPYAMMNQTVAERNRVCEAFDRWATKRHQEDPEWLKPLIGKSLKCHCAPKRCHAETLKRLANNEGLDKFTLHWYIE